MRSPPGLTAPGDSEDTQDVVIGSQGIEAETLEREHESQAIGYVGVCAITVGEADAPVETNTDQQELKEEMRLIEPQLFKVETEYPEEFWFLP